MTKNIRLSDTCLRHLKMDAFKWVSCARPQFLRFFCKHIMPWVLVFLFDFFCLSTMTGSTIVQTVRSVLQYNTVVDLHSSFLVLCFYVEEHCFNANTCCLFPPLNMSAPLFYLSFTEPSHGESTLLQPTASASICSF